MNGIIYSIRYKSNSKWEEKIYYAYMIDALKSYGNLNLTLKTSKG